MPELKEPPEWYMPKAWPLLWRRVFLITLPVSAPLWLAFMLAYALLAMFAVVFLGGPFLLYCYLKDELWDDAPSQHSSREQGRE